MKTMLALLSACLIWSLPAAAQAYSTEVVAEPLENPWSIAFLPDGRMLVTERPGRLRLIESGTLREEPIAGLPDIFVSGQAGLFDVLPAADFASTGVLYLSFAHGTDDANHVRIVRAHFDGQRLSQVQPVFTSQPAKSGDAHYGARMAWATDGTLLMGTGDGFFFRELSQQLDNHHGKIIRIAADGSVPADNPFVGTPDVLPEIYSYGHRNVQAIVVDGQRNRIYAHEHGPRGGDELNRIEAGRNYGWPMISYGRDYSRALITPFTELPDMEQPLLHWTPSIGPGGMTLYDGDHAPWRNSLFVAALAEKSLRRVPLDARGEPGDQETLLADLDQRIRDVRTGPDGALYVVTDESRGQVIRIRPGSGSGASGSNATSTSIGGTL